MASSIVGVFEQLPLSMSRFSDEKRHGLLTRYNRISMTKEDHPKRKYDVTKIIQVCYIYEMSSVNRRRGYLQCSLTPYTVHYSTPCAEYSKALLDRYIPLSQSTTADYALLALCFPFCFSLSACRPPPSPEDKPWNGSCRVVCPIHLSSIRCDGMAFTCSWRSLCITW